MSRVAIGPLSAAMRGLRTRSMRSSTRSNLAINRSISDLRTPRRSILAGNHGLARPRTIWADTIISGMAKNTLVPGGSGSTLIAAKMSNSPPHARE